MSRLVIQGRHRYLVPIKPLALTGNRYTTKKTSQPKTPSDEFVCERHRIHVAKPPAPHATPIPPRDNNMTQRWLDASLALILFLFSAGQSMAVDCILMPQDPIGGGYQAFPDVARLKDGSLMSVFYSGYWHISTPNAAFPKGGRIDYSISRDEGYTWTTPKTLYDSPYDDRDPSLTQLANGQLVLSFYSDPPSTGSDTYIPGTQIITSADLGKTWSAPRQIAPANYWTSSPIRALSNGRLIAPLYYLTGSSAADGTAFGAVSVSDNHGATWSNPKTIPLPGAGEQQFLCAETDVIQLKDGSGRLSSKLYAVERTNFDSAYFSTSADFGDTWTQSQAIGFNAHCPYLHRTADDIVLLGYRDYTGGVTALRYSLDECQTWSSEIIVDSSYGGAYTSIADLRDGTELITYYEEGSQSNIRVKRFRATADGIEWLPVVSSPVPEPGTMTLGTIAIVGLLLYGRRKRK